MSGIVGSRHNIRGSGLVGSLGTDGQVFTSSGAGAGAVFEAAAGGGKILQVVTATDSTNRSTTSTSFVTGSNTLSVDITPATASSRIFIQVCVMHYVGTAGKSVHTTIYRDDANLASTYGMQSVYVTSSNAPGLNASMSITDSPSTTSAVTYQVYFAAQSGTTAYLNYNSCLATITAIEIGA